MFKIIGIIVVCFFLLRLLANIILAIAGKR
jgi:hypothetical protein